MGRPEPSVLFSQTFTHPHLDEYVDEVLFTEPIVISACEFVEHNASCSSPMVSLVGATSPPSFAMEVFVQCEGEPRFRRLCQPFLYSHSSSNILEVEAIITNHIVIRGSYRSLTLVVYGNTAEDLGQFSIDYDLDNCLANAVCSPVDGKLDDLPPALQINKPAFEESISSLKSLFFKQQGSEIYLEVKCLSSLTLKLFKMDLHMEILRKVITILVSAALSIVSLDLSWIIIPQSQDKHHTIFDLKMKSVDILTEARKELINVCKMLPVETSNVSTEAKQVIDLDDLGVLSTHEVFYSMDQILFENKVRVCSVLSKLSEDEFITARLSLVLILCSTKEGCIEFISSSGIKYLSTFFLDDMPRSRGITLMVLGTIECLTRHAIGCEVFLGWWPREDDNLPSGTSEGYCYILKLLLQCQRHDIASLSMYLLHRLRLYEVAAKFESAVLVSIESSSNIEDNNIKSLDSLSCVNSGSKKLMNLLATSGSVDDPSPAARESRSSMLVQEDRLLSYKETVKLIVASKYCSANKEIDKHLLSLLEERGFLPLSAALLSSPVLRSGHGQVADIFSEIAGSIESILLSLLSCRSGLTFLLLQPEATAMIILSLQGVEDVDNVESMPLRFASALISKGFFCHPQDIGAIAEVHIRVVIAIDRLVSATPNTEEFLWSLWDLCALSRSDVGRQAMLVLGHFPEAISVLMEALRCVKGAESFSSGSSPLSLAIFHSAAELFEIMVMDTTASSLSSWIGHAVELHKALHSSSPGTSRKDAPTRLLEWIDAGVVYHKKGVVGLLRYAAVLASGGDAHLTSSSVLVSDTMDVENVVGDPASGSEIQVIEALLGKLVSDKYYDGVAFRDSSISQLTTAFRILAFIAENSAVSVSLYEEGAMMVLHVVLINCGFMLEQFSSTYDYLVDEGLECNSTADLLMERGREQSVINLLLPSLILLISLLQKLQEAREVHRNKKLLNILLRLHREVSPRLAACADDFSSVYSCSALGLGAVCNLLVSAIACWPVYGWTPSLFQSLLENGPSNISLAVGPKEACSLLYLLGDLFPEEGIWLWKNGRPLLSATRTLAVGTLVGLHRERDIDWYTQPFHFEQLLKQFSQMLEKIAQVTLHFAFSALLVIKDMLRVLIVRVSCQNLEYAAVIIRPVLSWLDVHLSEPFSLSDMDIFKKLDALDIKLFNVICEVQRLLCFVASLLEHPFGKRLLLKEGIISLLGKIIGQTLDAFSSDNTLIEEEAVLGKKSDKFRTWCLPILKSFELICAHWVPIQSASQMLDKCYDDYPTTKDCISIWHYVLKFCQVLPVGKELEACLSSFKELASCNQGKAALLSIFEQILACNNKEIGGGNMDHSDFPFDDKCNWIESPPLLICWRKLLQYIESESECQIEAVHCVDMLTLICLCLSSGGGSLQQRVSLIKCLFGIPHDLEIIDSRNEDEMNEIRAMLTLLDSKAIKNEVISSLNMKIYLDQVRRNIKDLFLMLENSCDMSQATNLSGKGSLSDNLQHLFVISEEVSTCCPLGGLEDKFMWECPDISLDKSSHPLPHKRKMTSLDASNRRQRGEVVAENITSSSFRLGGGTPSAPSGISRRDTFRQRKPNTSRPPSMHVDDYVARERSMDGLGGISSNVSSTQRAGSTSGRPPSIHVDEFMARQRERQNPVSPSVGEIARARTSLHESVQDPEKLNETQKLKPDLDDDHEINIVFDEELESDDVLSFPQPDGKGFPDSFNDETENEGNEANRFPYSESLKGIRNNGGKNVDISLRRSVPHPETSRVQDAGISCDGNQDTKLTSPFVVSGGYVSNMSANLVGPRMMHFEKGGPPGHKLGEPRLTPVGNAKDNRYQSSTPVGVSQTGYEQRPPIHQPPLPPVPPPPTVSLAPVATPQVEPRGNHASSFHTSIHDMHPPFSTIFPFPSFETSASAPTHSREDRPSHSSGTPIFLAPSSSLLESQNKPFQQTLQQEHESTAGNSSVPSVTLSHSFIDPTNTWTSVPSSSRLHDDSVSSIGPGRPLPPLPPTPHPLSTSIAQAAAKSASQPIAYSQGNAGVHPPAPTLSEVRGSIQTLPSSFAQFIPPLPPGRPTSIQGNQFSGIALQQMQNPSSHPFAVQMPQSIQAASPRPPLQPPQPQRPHHVQLPRPMIPVSQASEAIALQQSPAVIQIPIQPLPIQQALQVPQVQVYSQAPHQDLHLQAQQQVEHTQVQNVSAQAESMPHTQQDTGMSLQQYFASPEAIQSLLKDQDKLCQLLEKHPKLMQMLQERLTQL